MSGVELIGQTVVAYHLDRKSTIRFYLFILHIFFFDLIDVASANTYIVYNMMNSNLVTLLNFKTIVSTYLIGRDTSQSRAPDGKTGSKRKYRYQFD